MEGERSNDLPPRQDDEGKDRQAEGSSSGTNSATSPALDPVTSNAMNSSIISTLDLGDTPNVVQSTRSGDAGASDSAEKERGSNAAREGNDTDYTAVRVDAPSGKAEKPNVSPLAPHDVLGTAQRSDNPHRSLVPSSSGTTLSAPRSSSSTTLGADASFGDPDSSFLTQGGQADDSALNALMEAHTGNSQHSYGREDRHESSPHRPSKRDASFGLDPDVDKQHSVRGQALASQIFSPPSRSSHSRPGSVGSGSGHHHHHSHLIPDLIEEHAPSHTTASTGAPRTTETGLENTETVPTVSATGMPRFLPRHRSRSRSSSSEAEEKSEAEKPSTGGGRRRRRRSSASHAQASTSSNSSDAPPPAEMQPSYAPSGSLTLALFSSGITWRRRSYLLLASVAINLGLPFINGVMLGFGEIFARSIVAPWIGLAPAAININAPAGRPAAERTNGMGSTSTSGIGLRHAGKAAEQEKRQAKR